jgi:hypothetical protein
MQLCLRLPLYNNYFIFFVNMIQINILIAVSGSPVYCFLGNYRTLHIRLLVLLDKKTGILFLLRDFYFFINIGHYSLSAMKATPRNSHISVVSSLFARDNNGFPSFVLPFWTTKLPINLLLNLRYCCNKFTMCVATIL